MKTNYLFLLLALLLAACSGNDDRSDAYGNFEVDDVMVSAESPVNCCCLMQKKEKRCQQMNWSQWWTQPTWC